GRAQSRHHRGSGLGDRPGARRRRCRRQHRGRRRPGSGGAQARPEPYRTHTRGIPAPARRCHVRMMSLLATALEGNKHSGEPLSYRRRSIAWRSILTLTLTLAPASWAADSVAPPRYVKIPASPDGIGKSYLGREIAQVMGVGGAPWLERPERAHEEGTDLVLSAIDIKPGMVIADIGAGTGYYARRMARRTGSRGLVYAVEVQPAMMALLEKHLARHHATTVKTVLR